MTRRYEISNQSWGQVVEYREKETARQLVSSQGHYHPIEIVNVDTLNWQRMKGSWIRLALKNSVSKLDFDKAAWKYGWLWWEDIPRTENNPYEVIRTTRSNKTSIHYFDDHLMDVCYIIIDGSEEEAQKVHREICSSLDTYSYKDIRLVYC